MQQLLIPNKVIMKKEIDNKIVSIINTKKKLAALKTLGVGIKRYDVKPCKTFNPNCANCALYILEGSLEWYHGLLKDLCDHDLLIQSRKDR